MAQPSLHVVAGAAVKAVESAFKKYIKWSEGEWLEVAPESFLQMEIANAFSGLSKKLFVTVETSVKYIEEYSHCTIHGNAIDRRKRIDIVTWNRNWYPNYLCEVKKLKQTKTVEADAKRIISIMKCCDSIQYGLLVLYVSNKKEETITNKLNKIQDKLNRFTLFGSRPPKKDKYYDWFWGGACFYVSRKKL